MTTEAKPMDPERLADVRRWIAGGWTPLPRETEAELLADRDYQAQRAEEWERKAVGLGADALAETVRLKDEIARLRSRVRVEAEDVERAGVTWAHVAAWLRANGWSAGEAGAYYAVWHLGEGCVSVSVHPDHSSSREAARSINVIALETARSGLDILDEMARMEVTP